MEFINLQTGKIFNGSMPYIHWFEGEFGVNMFFNKKICFISDKQNVNISLNSNVFSLLNIDAQTEDLNIDKENINGFDYIDINSLKINNITSRGILLNNKYIHLIYIIAYSESPAEYIDSLTIDDEEIKIGIDLYEDNEPLYINMSNMGINIPNSIQKAIYPGNVHEDVDDKILLNRKWKELLSNYWDITANKGSYKSLMNSLKWFEWGDRLELKELWKWKDSIGKTFYDDKEILTYIEEHYKLEMCRFVKSTYYSINMAMQYYENGELDSEKNPILKSIVDNWSKTDLMLKLSMLGSFFETYFMPIHLDLIHSTIEDIVFTNTIKCISGNELTINDNYINNGYVSCNLDENNIFSLSNVSSQVNSNTLFGTKDVSGKNYEDIIAIGVDENITSIKSDEDLKIFMSQLFNGVGVMINIEYTIPLNKNDFITKEDLFLNINNNGWINRTEHKIINEQDGYAVFKFNILCCEEAEYDIRMNFITAGGGTYSKNAKFYIVDDSMISIGIFKIKHVTPSLSEWYNIKSNDYNTTRFLNKDNNTPSTMIKQYIPADNPDGTGVALNNILIFLSEKLDDEYFDEYHAFLRDNYFITHKDLTGPGWRKQYTICVSKQFWFDPNPWMDELLQNENINIKKFVYRNDYGYFPEFHIVEELYGDNLDDYTVFDNDAVCVIPMIGSLRNIPLKYGNLISLPEWEFENVSTGEIIKLDKSIREPYIANSTKRILSKGYYNVTFKYRLGSVEKTIKMNSAFLKK